MTADSRFLRAALIILLVVIPLCTAIVLLRAKWINEKIAALASPASDRFSGEKAAPPKSGQARVVLIGDSRIAKWPLDQFPIEWEIINRGIGGETSAQLAMRFASDALRIKPDLIFVESGINDLIAASFMSSESQDVVLGHLIESLNRVANQSEEYGITTIIGSIIPAASPTFFRYFFWNASVVSLVQRANRELRKVNWPTQVQLVDLSFLGGDKVIDAYRADTLHMNGAGYNRLTTEIISKMALALSKNMRPAPDKSVQ
jgi:lysophospholipase L1-like esterase